MNIKKYPGTKNILWQAIANMPDQTIWLSWNNQLGDLLRSEQRWDDAISTYESILEHNAAYWQAYIDLGWTRYRRGDSLEAALKEMYHALDLDSESGDVQINIGMLMGEARHCDESDTWFRLGLEHNTNNTWGQLMHANFMRACGNLDLALSLYKEILIHFPNFAPAYHEISIAYKLKNQPQEAIDAVEKSLELMDPPDPWFYVRAGEIYEWMGRIDDAVAAYQHALALDPNNSVALQDLKRLGK